MNNQELLDFINEKWPLGINTSGNVPKLRFQRDDKLIRGYSFNVLEGLKVDSNHSLKRKIQKFFSKQITNEELYQVIYSILYFYLAKCLLQLNVKKSYPPPLPLSITCQPISRSFSRKGYSTLVYSDIIIIYLYLSLDELFPKPSPIR